MSWFEGFHPDQSNWPYERIRGWGPGDYTCTCQDCGCHYMGAKRSVQCYPCAEKFVPPPRPETLEEKCDRLASELAQVRGELARTKRNHLRRMIDDAHARAISLENDFHTEQFRRSRRMPSDVTKTRVRMLRMHRLLNTLIDEENRAALERKEGV